MMSLRAAVFASANDSYRKVNGSLVSDGRSASASVEVEVDQALLVVLLVCISICAIFGNSISVWAFVRYHSSKRTVQNYYLAMLSVADFLVGAVSIPGWIYLFMTDYQPHWPTWACKLYLSADISACNLAVLSVLLISYDRYMLCSGTLLENNRQIAMRNTAIATVIALCLHTPFIVLWDVIAGESTVPVAQCNYEYSGNLPFTIVTSIFYYVVPLALLVTFNLRAYCAIRRRYKLRMTKLMFRVDLPSKDNDLDDTSLSANAENTTASRSCHSARCKTSEELSLQLCAAPEKQTSQFQGRNVVQFRAVECSEKEKTLNTPSSPIRRVRRREARIGRILLCVVLIFCLCWTPYMTYTAMCTLKSNWCSALTFQLTGSLLYSNSAINPFLYGLMHPNVRTFLFKLFRIKQPLVGGLPSK